MSPRRKSAPPPGEELTERQKLILALAVREYVDTAQPVASRRLVERYNLNFSAATVRNEFAALMRLGYLKQPHTSAGRVPTEKGYRYFVSRLIGNAELPPAVRHTIAHQFYQAQDDIDQWMRLAASVLARQARSAALVTSPRPEQARYKHLELLSLRSRQALFVLVLVGGEIRERVLHFEAAVSQNRLSAVADKINRLCAGKTAKQITAIPQPDDELEEMVLDVVRDELRATAGNIAEEVYRAGIAQVLSEPEFANSPAARRALRVLEERQLLERLLANVIANAEVGSVQVLVGGGEMEELRDCSVVLARYGAQGLATGVLGVVGPMRMAYSRAIPTVRFVARLLSELVTETLAE